MELPDMVVMHVFSHESVFSELDLTALGVPGVVCSIDSVLLLVEARLDTSRVAVRTSNTLHSLSRSLLSSCSTFSWKRRVRRRKHESGGVVPVSRSGRARWSPNRNSNSPTARWRIFSGRGGSAAASGCTLAPGCARTPAGNGGCCLHKSPVVD
jgi:hypothetical protein